MMPEQEKTSILASEWEADLLTTGPVRPVCVMIPKRTGTMINDPRGLSRHVRLYCYAFLAAQIEKGSTWQVKSAFDAAFATRGHSECRRQMNWKRTTVKIPDALFQGMEEACAEDGRGMSPADFMRGVIMVVLKEKKLV